MSNLANRNVIKCVVIGDGAVGKTAMLISYISNKFPSEYIPTVFDNYAQSLVVKGQDVVLDLWDTAGQEAYEKLRYLSYPGTDIFLVCFSITFPPSLENVRDHWIPEIRQLCPRIPYLLVGLKTDLRTNQDILKKLRGQRQKPLSPEQGEKIAKDLKAFKYVECSAMTQVGLKTIFQEAVIAAISPRRHPKQPKCIFL